jgi:hypothetical protein
VAAKHIFVELFLCSKDYLLALSVFGGKHVNVLLAIYVIWHVYERSNSLFVPNETRLSRVSTPLSSGSSSDCCVTSLPVVFLETISFISLTKYFFNNDTFKMVDSNSKHLCSLPCRIINDEKCYSWTNCKKTWYLKWTKWRL